MLHTAERLTLPTFRAMVHDLGNPPAHRLARVLGVHARTVERWRRVDSAPRSALLALWWLTSWGQSAVSVELYNRAQTYSAHLQALERDREALRRELARVLAAGEFGSANRPTFTPAAPVIPRRALPRL